MGKDILQYYLIGVNLLSCLVFYLDKRRAQLNLWRIPESTLLGLAIIGGSVGALLGMKLFHHKTKHLKFTLGLPLILCLQIGVAYCFRLLW
jgi:uncharacterized membrane protein YsdA (DUF1294 family)